MTDGHFLEKYLFERPMDDEEAQVRRNFIRPGRPQPLFNLVKILAARRDTASLTLLYSGVTPLHDIIAEAEDFRRDAGFADRAGPPFRASENGAVHATRALAALGLIIATSEPPDELWRSAVAWYTEARGWTASGAWDLQRVAIAQPRIAELASDVSDHAAAGAALAAAATLQALSSASTPRRQAGVTVLLIRSGEGVRADLKMSVVNGLPPGLVPDPEQMSLFTADAEFQRSLERAWSQVGGMRSRRTVVWSLEEKEGPSRQIDGESAGAAFTATLDEIRRLSGHLAGMHVIRRLQSANAIVGQINDLGYLQSVGGYEGKLAALGEHSRVIVPGTDAGIASNAAAKDMEIVPAADWKEAAKKARRRNRKVMLGQGIALALVVALVVGLFAWRQEVNAARQEANAAAQRKINLSNNLVATASSVSSTHPGLARQLLIAAYHIDPTDQARAALLNSQSIPREYDFRARVRVAAFSPDMPVLAVSTDQGVTLMDAETGGTISKVPSSAGYSEALAFTPQGDMLAAADANGHDRLWNISDPKHPSLVHAQLYPDSSTTARSLTHSGMLALTLPNEVDLFDTTDRLKPVLVQDFLGPPTTSTPAKSAISPDGRFVALGGSHNSVQLWDITSPSNSEQLATMVGPNVDALAFSPTGHLLAADGLANSTVSMWDVTNARHPKPLPGLSAGAGDGPAIAFSPDGETLAVAAGNTVQVWDVADPTRPSLAATLTGHGDTVNTVAFSADGQTLASGSDDNTLCLWNIINIGHSTPVSEMKSAGYAPAVFSPSGSYMVVGSPPTLWDVSNSARPVQLAFFPEGGFTTDANQVAFSPDSQTVATAYSGTITLWNLADPRHPGIAARIKSADFGALAFTDAHTLLEASFSTIYRWNIAIPAHPTALSSLPIPRALSRMSGAVGSESLVGLARPGDTPAIVSLIEHHQASDMLALSPSSQTLATVGPSGLVTLWNVGESPAVQLATLSADTTGLAQADFSSDGNILAYTNVQGVSLWDVSNPASPTLITTFTSTREYTSVAFSPASGNFLATTSLDGTVDLWDTSIPRIVNRTCLGTGTRLTPNQWNHYMPGISYANLCPDSIDTVAGRPPAAPATVPSVTPHGPPLNLRHVNWSSAPIPGQFCDVPGPVQLKGGDATAWSSRWGNVEFIENSPIFYGNIGNGAGEVAAVNVACTIGVPTSDALRVDSFIIFTGVGGKLTAIGNIIPKEQQPGVHASGLGKISISPGTITVHETFYRWADATCCPTGSATTIWTYVNGKLISGNPDITA